MEKIDLYEADIEAEKELRIIERMIKHYNQQLYFAIRTTSISEQTIEDIKENIKYLESLRDGKIEL